MTMPLIGWAWQTGFVFAQRHAILSPNIASLQVVAGTRWQEMPIIKLKGNEAINISFDELSHEYHRFTYDIIHLEADWTPSEGLFQSDYISGFNGTLTIDDYEQSINTLLHYTHYTLQLPNDDCRLLMSGNYRVDIKDDESGEIVARVCFMVNEDIANVALSTTDNTDIDVRKSHQQVELTVDYSSLKATDPRRQIKCYVLQNGRWDNARLLPDCDRFTQQYMLWTHCRDLIFDAGNVYHKFEMLDIHRNSLNVESNEWDGEWWNTVLWPDEPRSSYVYDETSKGGFYIRNTDNVENDVASEYVKVHFILKSPRQDHRLYLNGQWTNDRFLPQYEMHYNEQSKQYECVVPLKYGYYSYQYLMLADDTLTDREDDSDAGFMPLPTLIPPTEGSFYQTPNDYNALIYYKGNIDRTDRLVGAK